MGACSVGALYVVASAHRSSGDGGVAVDSSDAARTATWSSTLAAVGAPDGTAPRGHTGVAARVMARSVRETTALTVLRSSSGAYPGDLVTTTPDHRFFEAHHGWSFAGDLVGAHALVALGARPVIVSATSLTGASPSVV